MIVANVMTKNPVFVSPDMSVNDARALMTKQKIGKLPVLDRNNRLVGIITKKDLIKSGPSAATTLDMYEISYLLSKLKVEKVMERNVVSVQQTEVVEEAARIMADSDIGCLPVMKGDLLVGIITETDLFHVFIDMFGARHSGVRATFQVDEKPGKLAQLAQAIADCNGNIVSLVTCDGEDMSKRRCTCKATGITKEQMEQALAASGAELEDIR
ncbi:CBS domain-containing protein [Treponema brennaborense]|uniref:CBS domain containing membrane protein n=1 Tax=Treponema brennaborense (strain DSM 12168 / CIP 105900 / DD5/3) TaxID=906968 RepID=F4LLM7_TREBD|nr:CBS domain-containing protein [Treponema brennaborense]AEE17671.1 CBS domain containing membrane protein [Treponema brennaborense DSM 12168]